MNVAGSVLVKIGRALLQTVEEVQSANAWCLGAAANDSPQRAGLKASLQNVMQSRNMQVAALRGSKA